jgi:hypothetical protein
MIHIAHYIICIYYIVHEMPNDIIYNVVYYIVCFYHHHHFRPLYCLRVLLTMRFSLHSHYFARKLHTLHGALCRCTRCSHAALPPTHPVTINLYHFKGSVAHRPPLLHPDSPLHPQSASSTSLPLQFAWGWKRCKSLSAETPSSSPLHGRKKMACCTQIHTAVRLLDTHWGSLHTSWVHWPSVWRVAVAIFSGLDLQKNSISHPCSPDARPTGCTRCSKGSAHMPTAWEGIPG